MNKKILISVLIIFSVNANILAQISDKDAADKLTAIKTDTLAGWKFGSMAGLNFAQTKLVNWAAGGNSSLALNGIFSAYANYFKDKNSWINTLDLGYGLLNQDGVKPPLKKWQKTDDKINFSSQYGYKAYKNLYYAALFDFKTQFSPGYDDTGMRISDFFAPAYITAGIGVSYQPSQYLNIFLSPATARVVIVCDTALTSNYSIDEGKKTRFEFGAYARAQFTKNDFKGEFLKNVGVTTRLDLFSNYLKNPQNIAVTWETLIAFKVNKYISINLSTNLMYDDNTKMDIVYEQPDGTTLTRKEPRVQFKEILGIGASVKF